MRKPATALAAVLAVAATATPALAAGTHREVVDRFSEPYAGAVDCAEVGPWDHEVEYEGVEHVRVTEVRASDGTLLQTVLAIRQEETDTSSSSGASIRLTSATHEVWYHADGVRTLSGKVWLGTAPGGPLVQDTGRITLTLDTNELVSVHGPHTAFFEGLDELVCAGLAG
jgi:hypothetical protein